MAKKEKEKKVKAVTKIGINLATVKKDPKQQIIKIVVIALIVIVVLVGTKFGVIDLYNEQSQAMMEYGNVHDVYTALDAALVDYDTVQQEYRSVSRDWQASDTASQHVDRKTILNLIENEIKSKATVNSFALNGNSLSLQISDIAMSDVSEMLSTLENYDFVTSATLNRGSTSNNQTDKSYSISIELAYAEEAE